MFNYFFKNLNTLFLTCALAFISIANAQEVRVIDNKGTIKIVNNNQVTTGTAPAVPILEGDVWFDTNFSPTQTKIYDGGNWVTVVANSDSNVYTGVFVIDRATDLDIPDDIYTKNIAGIPFQPSQVTFVAHANVALIDSEGLNLPLNENNIDDSFGTMNGFANASTDPIVQQVIYVGGSGASINTIGWYSSSNDCIGVRYGNKNAVNLGIIKGALQTFTTDGFDITVTCDVSGTGDDDFRDEKLVVLYTAYK
jgi:hypothetical protein